MESTNKQTCKFCGTLTDSVEHDYHSDCADSAYQEHLAELDAQAYEDATESTDRCVW